jgi:hypothetical protein
LELFAGWPVSAIDIGTGGLLYGDDHPSSASGKSPTIKYQLVLSIQNTPVIGAKSLRVTGLLFKPDFTFRGRRRGP